jgi:hypothetical protein
MADLAHDASGPASSEPAGIAVQQAGRPASSEDRGKLRVFISYSRDDLNFADQLDAALSACGFEARAGLDGFVRLLPGLTLGDPRLIRPFRRPKDRERFLDGLRKAGLPK